MVMGHARPRHWVLKQKLDQDSENTVLRGLETKTVSKYLPGNALDTLLVSNIILDTCSYYYRNKNKFRHNF